MSTISTLKKYVRLANYIAAAQIYLKDNFLIEEPLQAAHIKSRLLGHWGTVPAQNFMYACLNYIIKKYKQEMIFISGPGHGFPAVSANLWMEGTYSKFYKKITRDKAGLGEIIKKFSWPYGYPSHANPGAPGTIYEGGELGYSLSTAFGAVMDNPDLMVACCVGDGEAETGPLATAWQSIKFINPARDGAVLPILNLNGYKIAGPTLFGVMNDSELKSYFTGLGYEPIIVDYGKKGFRIYQKMVKALEYSYKRIRQIRSEFKHKKNGRPRWPMIILRTPKGWTGVEKAHGLEIVGTWRSHQVDLPKCKTEPKDLALIEKWLRSYKVNELLTDNGDIIDELKRMVPSPGYRMGDVKYAMCDIKKSKVRKELKLPDIKKFEVKIAEPGELELSPMKTGGNYVGEIFKYNKNNFRIFCPDETESNRLGDAFKYTDRMMMWPFDKKNNPQMSSTGRVMEMLSEHTQVGWLQGYLLTGRHGVFSSYEAFAQIVSSMVDQHAKFLKASREHSWRQPISSMNILISSLGWRQDHNGFSHQNPGFMSELLDKHGDLCSVYLPADANSMLVTLEDCFKRTNAINVVVSGKRPQRQWLSLAQARKQLQKGAMVWDFASDKDPDIVLSSGGDYVTQEIMYAMDIIRSELPELKMRYVNVSELTALGLGDEKHVLTSVEFDKMFTDKKPIIFNFHGYPGTVKKLFFDYIYDPARLTVNGYVEEGSTTTPFDMLVRNGVSRFQVVNEVMYEVMNSKPKLAKKAKSIMKKYAMLLEEHKKYVKKYGDDPDWVNG